MNKTDIRKGGEGMTPKELAAELQVDPKQLRGYLRKEFPRGKAHGTSWDINAAQAKAARARFKASKAQPKKAAK
jgi:hypothetical protein